MTQTSPAMFEPRAAAESYVVSIDWSDVVASSILTSNWSVVPDDGTLQVSAPAVSGLQTSARLSGGTPGTAYAVRNVVAVAADGGPDIYAVSVRQDVTW